MSGPEAGRPRPDGAAALGRRIALGTRSPENWLQLGRFAIVGGSGYVVNLIVFSLAVGLGDLHHFPAAALAFGVAVVNNFLWNRRWTFRVARGSGDVGGQGARFLAVSLIGLGVNLAVLGVLVDLAGLPEIPSQALAVATALPVNFVGNRLWTFRRAPTR